jgi:outer membrane protein OmpA-like peptidoglycan-associated protein
LGVLAVVCAALASACGPQRATLPAAGLDVVVLLPDSGGTVGRASVSNQSGATDLTEARAATTVMRGQAPSPAVVMDEATVAAIVGDALAALPRAPESFVLFFQLDSNELTNESRARLPEVIKAITPYSAPEVVTIGHTDTTGDRKGNIALGLSRANAVRGLLINAGLKAALIEVVSYGETDLLVKTPDDTFEPRNRRVEITVR